MPTILVFWTRSQNDFGTDVKTVFSTQHGTLQRARVTLSNIKQTCHQCVCVFGACEHEREYEVQVFLSFWVCETLVRMISKCVLADCFSERSGTRFRALLNHSTAVLTD
mgnify:CR=1 FL=1